MAIYYPSFELQAEAGVEGGSVEWAGTVQPIRDLSALSALLEDVEAERDVHVIEGTLHHHPDCDVPHRQHRLTRRLISWCNRFEVRVRYDGGDGDPRCWLVAPAISQKERRHIWPDGSMCAFMSSEAWNAEENDVVDFMTHVPIWLLKWNLFRQTGLWLGREHQGTPDYHLRMLRPSDNCWCRSGRRYAACHRGADHTAVAQKSLVPAAK